MAEQAFRGTIKEGFKRRYTILNERDYRKYISGNLQDKFENILNEVLGNIQRGVVPNATFL